MPLYRSSNTSSSPQPTVEVAALVPDAPDNRCQSPQSSKRSMALTSSVILKKEASLSLSATKAGRKRGGVGGPKSTESAFSSLLQPILALFPPNQAPSPLAPAFDLKLPNYPKGATERLQASADSSSDVKAKTLTHADDEDAFVIYQPASWSAKRTKQSAARMAYTFDWRTDVFGPSPDAVRGQRTKYPKPTIPAPSPSPLRQGPAPIQHSVLLRNLMRDRAGSLASVSDASSVSFASTLEEGVDSHPITPWHGQSLPDVAAPQRGNAFADVELEDDLSTPELLASPTGAVAERLSKLAVVSPSAAAVVAPFQEEKGVQTMDIEEEEDALCLGSTPYTPQTPRSIPDSDEESDDD